MQGSSVVSSHSCIVARNCGCISRYECSSVTVYSGSDRGIRDARTCRCTETAAGRPVVIFTPAHVLFQLQLLKACGDAL